MEIQNILKLKKIIPTLVINDLYHAIPMATALNSGGIKAIEIALGNEIALEAIKLIKNVFPNLTVGANNIFESRQLVQAKHAGVDFVSSPGFSNKLCITALEINIPFIPGAATPAEIIQIKEFGFSCMKFCPAEELGGPRYLQRLSTFFPDIFFFPSGGILRANMTNYLHLKNVIAVGGDWLTPDHLLKERNWEGSTDLTKSCLMAL